MTRCNELGYILADSMTVSVTPTGDSRVAGATVYGRVQARCERLRQRSGSEAHSIWRQSFGWHPTSQDTGLKRDRRLQICWAGRESRRISRDWIGFPDG